jgi:hypothetical protein
MKMLIARHGTEYVAFPNPTDAQIADAQRWTASHDDGPQSCPVSADYVVIEVPLTQATARDEELERAAHNAQMANALAAIFAGPDGEQSRSALTQYLVLPDDGTLN